MNKKLAKMDKQTRFEFCRDRMREYTAAYWDMVLEIYEGELWENEYDSFDEFRRAEIDFSERRVRQRLSAERTKRLCDRQKLPVDKAKTAHFEAIAAVEDETERVEIYKEVLADCKEEGREPTTKDFKKAVKQRMPEPETNGKAHEPETDGWPDVAPEREPGEDEPEEVDAEKAFKLERTKWIKTLEAMMRGVDDMNRVRPNPGQLKIGDVVYKDRHDAFLKVYHQAHGILKGWK